MQKLIKNRGFSLIEVMIALLVLALGILGISKLQGTLIRNSSDANQRSVAASLAQMKIDDLKSYVLMNRADVDGDGLIEDTADDAWQAGLLTTQQSFSYIASNQGGAADSSPDNAGDFNRSQLINGDLTFQNYIFNLSWTVGDYYFDDADADPLTPEVASTTPSGDIDFKTVEVTVTWDDEWGAQQQVVLSTVIDSYAPAITSFADNSNTGGDAPRVTYTPGTAPDIVNIDVGDLDGNSGVKRETSTPEITVSQNQQFVEYDFSVVTYNSNNELIKQEDFRQINCVCEQESTNVDSYYPATMELAFDETTYINKFDEDSVDFKVSGKKWGTRISTGQYGQQSEDCTICCRDHHDKTGPSSPDKLFDPFRPVTDYSSGDHKHYFPDAFGVLQTANNAGDIYLEACLLAKVDGIFRVAQDLNLLTVKTMPEAFLLSTGFDNYQTYKENYLLAYAKAIDASSSYPAQTIGHVGDSSSIKYLLNDASSLSVVTLVNEPDMIVAPYGPLSVSDIVALRAKSLYARYIPSEVFSKLTEVTTGSSTWLEISNLLPFYDPDVTIISQTGEDTSAWGTTDPSEVSVDQTGELTAISATAVSGAVVTATRSDSTSGFTNTRPIDPNDESSSYLTADPMTVVVSGTAPPSSVDVKFTVTASGNSGISPNTVSVVGSNGALCGLEANNVKYVHICSFASGTGKITISDFNSSYIINPGKITVIVDNEVCVTGVSMAVTNEGAIDETVEIVYSGLVSPVADKMINIVLEADGC